MRQKFESYVCWISAKAHNDVSSAFNNKKVMIEEGSSSFCIKALFGSYPRAIYLSPDLLSIRIKSYFRPQFLHHNNQLS